MTTSATARARGLAPASGLEPLRGGVAVQPNLIDEAAAHDIDMATREVGYTRAAGRVR